jgi:hypothetical protein
MIYSAGQQEILKGMGKNNLVSTEYWPRFLKSYFWLETGGV